MALNVASTQASASQQNQALTPWFAALSNRLSARCNVVCLGDSITEGMHAAGPPSTGFENRWVERLADMLRSRYPTARAGQSGYTFPWSQYVSAALNVAAADTSGPGGSSIVSVLDFTSIPTMPAADNDAYGFWQPGDLIHPSNRGHQMIADCLTAFLSQS
jgi:lysophospholipase L1-like esterase